MATQTEQITELIQEASELNETFHEKEGAIEAKVKQAENRVDKKIP